MEQVKPRGDSRTNTDLQEGEGDVTIDLGLDVDFNLEVEVQPELQRLPVRLSDDSVSVGGLVDGGRLAMGRSARRGSTRRSRLWHDDTGLC